MNIDENGEQSLELCSEFCRSITIIVISSPAGSSKMNSQKCVKAEKGLLSWPYSCC